MFHSKRHENSHFWHPKKNMCKHGNRFCLHHGGAQTAKKRESNNGCESFEYMRFSSSQVNRINAVSCF